MAVRPPGAQDLGRSVHLTSLRAWLFVTNPRRMVVFVSIAPCYLKGEPIRQEAVKGIGVCNCAKYKLLIPNIGDALHLFAVQTSRKISVK